jgi:hypothetical protein
MSAKTDARQQALNQVRDALRALAANVIEIVRGAGKPLELSFQVEAFSAALEAFERAAEGRRPKAWEFAEMLRVDIEPKLATPTTEDDLAEHYAQHAVIQASLQLAAARLLEQEPGAAEALAELHAALSGFEETKRRIEKRRDETGEPTVAPMTAPEASGRSS